MKRFTLDGAAFDSLEGFWSHAGDILCPGFDWGRNLDAFNDILRGGFGAFECDEPIELVWLNADQSRRALGPEETLAWLHEGLTRIHPSNLGHWRERIAAVRRGEGPTLFDELVEIIGIHPHVAFTMSGGSPGRTGSRGK